MGLALGKSIAEIRALPAPEFRRWQLFYALEPWGWQNEEYRTAVLLAQNYNMKKGKGKAKKPADFMRDMLGAAIEQMQDAPPELDGMTEEQQREFIKARIKKDFGIR